jgi:chromosome segregation ATPase
MEIELRQHNQRLETECKDLQGSIQDIQPKYQEALNDRARFELEKTNAASGEETMRKRFEGRQEEIIRLRSLNISLDAELQVARTALTSSAVPELAELYQTKEDLVTTKADKDRLQKRVSNMENDLEYMRGNYQNASAAASEAYNELGSLKEENAVLARRASQNAVRIHEIQASNEIKTYLKRINVLDTEKKELVRELDKKNEELRSLMNGRRNTRGVSVPRSPHMNNMSPGTRVNRVIGASNSRGNSPAPSEPLRGIFTTDNPLYAATAAGTRLWPNHLT